jgi:hypothetical protein
MSLRTPLSTVRLVDQKPANTSPQEMAKASLGPVNIDQEISAQTNEDKLLIQVLDAFRSQS